MLEDELITQINNLKEELEAEREWRIKEFTRIKLIYRKLEQDENFKKEKEVFSRMTIPTIYAHWEGYCVSSFKDIIMFINNRKLKSNEVKNSLLTHSNNMTYNKLKGKQSFKQRCEFTTLFIELLGKDVKLDTKVDTKSNLNYDAFVEICEVMDINCKAFNKYKAELNQLVNIRNSIAHGENSFIINKEKIEQYSTLVIEMIDVLLIEQYKYLDNGLYLNT